MNKQVLRMKYHPVKKRVSSHQLIPGEEVNNSEPSDEAKWDILLGH
jgi:hypothetical protein